MKARLRWLALPLLAATAALAAILLPGSASSVPAPANKVIAHQLDIELGKVKPQKWEQALSSSTMYTALAGTGVLDARAASVKATPPNPSPKTLGCQNTFTGGPVQNIRVNQDCSFRRQAEEVVAVNPTDNNNLVAGQNDSSIGFNHCGYDYSLDGGKTWGSQIPPFYGFIMGDDHTADACSDPTVTFDADGNAYIGGVLFDLASPASAFVVAKSNAAIKGAFWHSPAPGPFQTFTTNVGVVASDNDPCIAHDKEFIVADANASSSKKNTVYATWTRFNLCTGAGVGADSPIYFSQSTDGGATWSPGIEISGASTAFCTAASGESNAAACDQDQGSDPIVGSDGTIYVSFFNGNTQTVGINQHMIVKCPAASDCSNPASWSKPNRIAIDNGLQPFGPDPTTGCPAGRQCIPPNGYRVADETFGSLAIDNNNTLYHVFSDARNIKPNCNPLGPAATATPPCDTDVFFQYSKDGGATWSPEKKITPAGSAQWMPWGAVTKDGSKLYIAYYDRSYGNCEMTGCNDITLASVRNAATSTPSISYQRITTSSMPNLVTANNPVEAGFLGDYMWVTTDANGRAWIAWADTRGQNGAVEEDVYTAQTNP
jgi:hypothetical protein